MTSSSSPLAMSHRALAKREVIIRPAVPAINPESPNTITCSRSTAMPEKRHASALLPTAYTNRPSVVRCSRK